MSLVDQLEDSLRSGIAKRNSPSFLPLSFTFYSLRSIKYKGEFHWFRVKISGDRRFRYVTDLRFFFEQLLSMFYHNRVHTSVQTYSNSDESNPNHLTSHHLETIRINLQYEISNTRRCSRNTDPRYSVLIRGFRKFRRLATEPPLVRPSPVSTRWKLSTTKGHHPRCIISFRSRDFQLSDSRFHLSVPIATEM